MKAAQLDAIEASAKSLISQECEAGHTCPSVDCLRSSVRETERLARVDIPALIAEIRGLRMIEVAAMDIDRAATNFEAWRRTGWNPQHLTDGERATLNDLHVQLRAALGET